eukprot:SAG25_NODE_1334_length_3275_cov_2.165617_5_plen_102_part_01
MAAAAARTPASASSTWVPPPSAGELGAAPAAGWFTSNAGTGGHSLSGVAGSTVLVEQLRSECAIALKACDYTLLKRLATQLESMALEQQRATEKAHQEAAAA